MNSDAIPRSSKLSLPLLALLMACLLPATLTAWPASSWLPDLESPEALEEAFLEPPPNWKVGAFYIWPNTIGRETISRELETMQAAGFHGLILAFNRAHSAGVPAGQGGVGFLSPEHLQLIRHALDECERLGMTAEIMLGNGWFPGGPWVTPELNSQILVWSETVVQGGGRVSVELPLPEQSYGIGKIYKGIGGRSVFKEIDRRGLEHLQPVAVTAYRLNDAGELIVSSFVRLDDRVDAEGRLTWDAPEGDWIVFRYGQIPNLFKIKNPWPGYEGLQIDHLTGRTVEVLFEKMAAPILDAAGPHVGKTLTALHDESIEPGYYDWTAELPGQFEKRRGYNPIPWLPVLAGKSFAKAPYSGRFLEDFHQTLDDLLTYEYYGTYRRLCHENGLRFTAECGTADWPSVQVKAASDLPMGEFWLSMEGERPRLLRRYTSFAANIYGQRIASFEAFTTATHWLESPHGLKRFADQAFSLGVNHLVLVSFSSSPRGTAALPTGDVYFAGTHFSPELPWWDWAEDFFAYLNRCQITLQAGWPVADVLFLEGPATDAQRTTDDALHSRQRYDWNAAPGHQITSRLKLDEAGKLAFHPGMSYRILAIADVAVDLQVLRKARDLVNDGATLWLKELPKRTLGLYRPLKSDQEVRDLVRELTGGKVSGTSKLGKGQVFIGQESAGQVFEALGVAPDFAYTSDDAEAVLRYAHRRGNGWDVWFVSNGERRPVETSVRLRITGRQPELWDPVSGTIEKVDTFAVDGEVTEIPLRLAANESVFLVFRQPLAASARTVAKAGHQAEKSLPVGGPWEVHFRPEAEGEEAFTLTLPELVRWETHPELEHFAGSAIYRSTLEVPTEWFEEDSSVKLDLGWAHLAAEVTVNGKACGKLWTAPWSVDVSDALKPGRNTVEIRVANTWHNWRRGHPERFQEPDWFRRYLNADPLPSGLDGPVTLNLARL